MKRLAFILFLLPMMLFGAEPPYLRNIFDTNANPYIIGTNGINVTSNRANGLWFIDGFALTPNSTNGLATTNYVNTQITVTSNGLVTLIISSTNGLQRALQFDATQFTLVNGTNVAIKSGAWVTNLTAWGSNEFALVVRSPPGADEVKMFFISGTPSGGITNAGAIEGSQYGELYVDSNTNTTLHLNEYADGAITFGLDPNSVAPRWAMNHVALDFSPGDVAVYTIGALAPVKEFYTSSGGLQAQINTKHQKFSIWSNDVEIIALGDTTNFNFIGFDLLTNANGKLSIGASQFALASTTNVFASKSSMTNALLWDGPTNGSVGAKILTGTTNVVLSTLNDTNRQVDTAQPITTTASPTFANLTLTASSANQGTSTNTGAENHGGIQTNWTTLWQLDNTINMKDGASSLTGRGNGDVPFVIYRTSTQLVYTNSKPQFFSNVVSFTIPANLLGTNKGCYVTASGDLLQNSGTATNFALAVVTGSTTNFQSGAISTATAATRRAWNISAVLYAKDSTSAQGTEGSYIAVTPAASAVTGVGGGGTAIYSAASWSGTSAVDSTASVAFKIAITFASGTNTDFRVNHVLAEIK